MSICQYLVSWDMYGLEALINITTQEQENVLSILKEEKIKYTNPIQYMLLRARVNSHRKYEIYVFDSELTTEEIVSLFKTSPQLMADSIRRIGHQMYSDRADENSAKPLII